MITKTFHSTEYTKNFTMQRRFDLLIRINPVHSVHIREQMLFVWLRTQYSCTEKAKHFLISSPHLVNTSGLSLQQELLLNFFKTLPPTIVPLRRRPDRSILFLRFFRGIRNEMKISSASSYAPSKIQAVRSNGYIALQPGLCLRQVRCVWRHIIYSKMLKRPNVVTSEKHQILVMDLTSSKNEKKKGWSNSERNIYII